MRSKPDSEDRGQSLDGWSSPCSSCVAGRRGSKLQAADGGREEGIGYRTERVGET